MSAKVIGTEVQRMFGSIARRYDLANSVLSLGLDRWWRHRLLNQVLPSPGSPVLDLCTGTGVLLPLLTERFGQVVGLDFCLPMLMVGRSRASKDDRQQLVQGDALMLPFKPETFDLATVAFGVRNFEDLRRGLLEILRVLRPGGRFLILEFGQPSGVIWGALFRLYSSLVLPWLGGILTGNRGAYSYLRTTSSQFPCGEDFNKVLIECGFCSIESVPVAGGVAYTYIASKPS